jgi:alpha,alpha-trehalase
MRIKLKLVEIASPQFIQPGGITGSTKAIVAGIPREAPQRQWDYFWLGPSSNVAMGRLNQLWISDKAQEMIYRWLWLITKCFWI